MFNIITDYSPDGSKVIICEECKSFYIAEEKRQQLEIIIINAPKIVCPYCEQSFPKLTIEQYKDRWRRT